MHTILSFENFLHETKILQYLVMVWNNFEVELRS